MKKNTKGHLLGILIFSTVAMVLDYINFPSQFHFIREVIFLGIEIWIFYSTVYAITLARRIRLLALPAFAASFGITLAMNHGRGLVGLLYNDTLFENTTDFFINTITVYFRVGLYSVGYLFFRQMLEKQRQSAAASQAADEAEKRRLEAENHVLQLQEESYALQTQLLVSEINFLKAQINPHFLFNCLNFFYSEALGVQPKLAEAIITLSQIMRYSMQDFSKKGNIANLEEEIEHIENVIKIHRMRYLDNLYIRFRVNGNPAGIQLAPMVLITLVENVFKHGDLSHSQTPAVVSLTVDHRQNKIHFTSVNRKKSKTVAAEAGSQIGIQNIRKRLERLYRNEYKLEQEQNEDRFSVSLEFPFSRLKSEEAFLNSATNNQMIYD